MIEIAKRLIATMIFPFAVTVSRPEASGRAGDNHAEVYETRPAPQAYRTA